MQRFCLPLVLLALAAANLLGGFPGIGGYDSDLQYAQALSGHYSDWHPPVMAWLWSYLLLIAKGNAPMFVLQVFFYWLGFALLAHTLYEEGRKGAAWVLVLVSIFPPFLHLNMEIFKDVGMAVCFLSAFALIARHRLRQRPMRAPGVALIALLLLYGMLVRANGVFAGVPLVLYAVSPSLVFRPVRFAVAFVAAVGLAIGISGVINHQLLRAAPDHPIRSLQLYDVVGIAHYSKDMSVFWPGPFTAELVDKCYTPILWDPLIKGDTCHIFWDSESPKLTQAWVSAIAHHPLAYAMHRLAHLNSELDFIMPRHYLSPAFKNAIVSGVPIAAQPLTAAQAALDMFQSSALFSPALALIVGLAELSFCYFATRQRFYTAALYLAISGTAYMGSFAVVGVASDERYQFWPMMAVYIALVLALSGRKPLWGKLQRRQSLLVGCIVVMYIILLIAHITQGDAVPQLQAYNLFI